MSKPNEKAWDAAMHMLKWLYQNKERGLIFRSTGNASPIAYVDSSNETDPEDGKVQAGYCIMLAGAPVVFASKKLKHVSPTNSTAHVEYMAMSMCNQSVVWVRQLLQELDAIDMLDGPTVVFGDNKCANQLCKEHFISTGNQYIYNTYHCQKELEEMDTVDVQYKRSAWNLANVFTKPVDGPTSLRLFGKLCGYVDFQKATENEGL